MKYGAITQVDAGVMDEVFAQFKNQTVRVLEIGVYHGETAIGMKNACAANGCQIDYWGIDQARFADPDPPFAGVHYIVSPSHEAWKQLSGVFDVIFIDGCHCLAHVFMDITLYSGLVAPGGYLILHDTAPHLQGVQDNVWVHPTCPESHTNVLGALRLLGWPNKEWPLWKEAYDPPSDIGGVKVFRRAA